MRELDRTTTLIGSRSSPGARSAAALPIVPAGPGHYNSHTIPVIRQDLVNSAVRFLVVLTVIPAAYGNIVHAFAASTSHGLSVSATVVVPCLIDPVLAGKASGQVCFPGSSPGKQWLAPPQATVTTTYDAVTGRRIMTIEF